MIDFNQMPRFKPFQFQIVSLIPEWARSYQVSEEAITRQLAWAHGWIMSNKKKAPKKDVVRFLFNWMRLAKKHGNLVTEPLKFPQQKLTESEADMSYEEMVAIRKKNMGAH